MDCGCRSLRWRRQCASRGLVARLEGDDGEATLGAYSGGFYEVPRRLGEIGLADAWHWDSDLEGGEGFAEFGEVREGALVSAQGESGIVACVDGIRGCDDHMVMRMSDLKCTSPATPHQP